MKRVVITGLGIISSIGNHKDEVKESLLQGKSGIEFVPEYKELGFRSHVAGTVKNLDLKKLIDRKSLKFMGQASSYAYLAMREAIDDANLSPELISNVNTGLIVGSGGASNQDVVESANLLKESGVRKVGPYRVTRSMSSTTSACLATLYKIKGTSFSVSSACATSSHCIGLACEQIQFGKQKMMFAGGGEELHWSLSVLFDAMGALSSKNNENPTKASRAFDKDRDGFVIAGGGGILVLEELEHAINRGAKIYAEVVGFGSSSDGDNMVQPSQDGAARCMQSAIQNVDKIDYINAHGTSTVVGDSNELNAIASVFKDEKPMISSTKSLTGHSLGAAGVQEAIYSLIMLENNFITPSANVENIMEEGYNHNIVTQKTNQKLTTVMSNSFGFGGVNASLVFKKYLGS